MARWKLSPDVAALNPDLRDEPAPSKYHNQPVVIDEIRFDSKAEGDRYVELRMLESAGVIEGLRLQVWFDLYGGVRMRLDFAYSEDGKRVAEDVKGHATRDWLNKAKLFRARYPEIELRIVRR